MEKVTKGLQINNEEDIVIDTKKLIAEKIAEKINDIKKDIINGNNVRIKGLGTIVFSVRKMNTNFSDKGYAINLKLKPEKDFKNKIYENYENKLKGEEKNVTQ